MISVLIVDDQPLVRAGLRLILEPQDDIAIVGECDDGDQVLHAVNRERPDVVLMDVRMRRMSGVEATRRLRGVDDAPPVLILTTFDDDQTVATSLRAGAAGFILKDARGEEIVRATTIVAEGGSWLDPQITGRVLDAYRRHADEQGSPNPQIKILTERELDVLWQVAQGANNSEVAAALCISEATVKTHLNHILTKLDLRDRSAAIVFAHQHGLASPRSSIQTQ